MNTRIWLVALSLLALSLPSFADQPRMESALAALQEARAQLQNASVDKGGHRVKALRAVDQAIAEVKAGIAFDRTHQSRQENQRP